MTGTKLCPYCAEEVRAQAVDRRGNMVDDFYIEEAPGAIHVLNAPSPAATSSTYVRASSTVAVKAIVAKDRPRAVVAMRMFLTEGLLEKNLRTRDSSR